MARWVEDGVPTIVDIPSELAWPAPIAVNTREMVLIIESESAPLVVSMSLYGEVDAAGRPLDAPKLFDCKQGAADCLMTVIAGSPEVRVTFDLARFPEVRYLAIQALWRVDSIVRATQGIPWPAFEAAWLFQISSRDVPARALA